MTFRDERFHWGDDGEFDWHPRESTKAWDESQHPREPAGSPTGGQFTGDGGGAPAGPAPKLPSVADVPPYKGRREDVHPDDGKKIYDNRVDPQYLTKSPKLKDVTEVTSGLHERNGKYYQRYWGRRDANGDLIIIEVNRKGGISSPDWFKLEKDPFEETVQLDRGEAMAAPAQSDEDMRLVGSGVDLKRVEEWQKGLQAQLDTLEKAGKAGDDEWSRINRMEIALGFYLNASPADRMQGYASLVEVHDGNNKLLATVFTQHNPKTAVSTIEGIGTLERAALVKALNHTVLHEQEGNKAERIEKVEFSDQEDILEPMRAAGFRPVAMETPGVVRMVIGKEQTSIESGERERQKELHSREIQGAAEASAVFLGYSVSKVVMSATPHNFTIGEHAQTAAGTAHPDGRIVLYPEQIWRAKDVPGIMAHEVMHQKYRAVQAAFQADRKAFQEEPGPPPNPQGATFEEREGGRLMVINPDGSPRPPYDKKYPLYADMIKHFNSMDKRAKSDGVSDYSKEYWDVAYQPGTGKEKAKFDWAKAFLAENETLAEMARIELDTEKLPGKPAWRSYYKSIAHWYDELRKVEKASK